MRRGWILLAVWLVGAGLSGCTQTTATDAKGTGKTVLSAPVSFDAGAKRTAARMAELERTANPLDDRFLNRRRAELLNDQLGQATDPRQQVMLLQQLAIEIMNAGESRAALEPCDKMQMLLARYDPGNESGLRLVPDTLKAIAYLRLGEVENCCASGSPDACLLPIRRGGIHTKPEGSRKAIELLTGVLNQGGDDLGTRWLLNIAYMTLGEYPARVPKKWLLPTSAFASEYKMPEFRNVAHELGLDVNQLAGGVIFDDFDNDDDLDLLISSFGLLDEMHYFVNDKGTFTSGTTFVSRTTFVDKTKDAGLIGITGGQNLIQADYNNDGHTDFLVLRGGWRGKGGHHPRSLLKNNGDGTFSEVADEAGIQAEVPCMTAVWFDYDNDGWLDLFFGNESTEGDPNPCQLYRNNHDGTFTEVAAEVGLNFVGLAKAAVSLDYNNDNYPDLFVSCWREPNRLYRNRGGKRFVEVGKEAGVTEPLGSFSCFAFDYDNDGNEDIFVTDYDIQSVKEVIADYVAQAKNTERARLFRNKGDGTFADVTKAAKLYRVIYGMGINFGDLDNDGWLDFYVGTGAPNLSALVPNRMFRNAEGKFFQDVTTSGNFGHLQKGHAIAFADYDEDGDQDIFESMGGAFEGDVARSVLFQNPGSKNSWLKLKLVGKDSCRDAHGARIKVTVTLPGGKTGEMASSAISPTRAIYRTVGTGGSFGGNPLRQEIGLGNATAVQTVEIRWPRTGKTQTITGLTINQTHTITEQPDSP